MFDAKPDLRPPAAKTIEALVGPEAWARLPPIVRDRFTRHSADYAGHGTFRANLWGRLCALFGLGLSRPLPLGVGAGAIAIEVRPEGDGERWLRKLDIAGRRETVSSVKRPGAGPWLEETAQILIMRLDVCEEAGALVFNCTGFRLKLCGFDLPWPLPLTPGQIRVAHLDHGGGAFAFTLEAHHPWFGLTFDQRCEMRDI